MYFLLIALGWLYSIGITANEKLAENLRMPPIYLRIAVVVPFVYIAFFVAAFLIPLYQGKINQPPQGLIIMHFVCLFAIVYCIWFSAKQFSTLREKRETSLNDYYPAFLGFWFGFIGVWFLQPKVREVFSQEIQS